MKTSVRNAGKKGRGVFAKRTIRKNDLIEACQVLIMPQKDWKKIEKTFLAYYVFEWGFKDVALALGNGSLYNHSENPNCRWSPEGETLQYRAERTIHKGEEICINYGYQPRGYAEDLDSGLKG